MRQFGVHRLHGARLVVNLQSDLREGGATRVVAPVIPVDEITSQISDTDVRVVIDGDPHIIPMDLMTAVRTKTLDTEAIADLSVHHDAFIGAIDLIFTGF